MAKIHTLKISNFKGLEKFEHVFVMTDFVCLIGRGDSGETTIIEVILKQHYGLTDKEIELAHSIWKKLSKRRLNRGK